MIVLITVLVLVYLAIFAQMLLRVSLKRVTVDAETGAKKWQFNKEPLTRGFISSRLLWALIGTFMFVYALSLVVILVWMLYTGLKPNDEYIRDKFALPQIWAFENYKTVLQNLYVQEGLYRYGVGNMLLNSFLHAGVPGLVGIFWTTVVAYIMSRFNWPGNKFLYNLGIVLMMISIVGTSAQKMILYKAWGLYDNMYVTMLLPPATAFSGMNFLILYGALKVIPKTYSEAAYLDGASEMHVMFKIIIPMVIPTCATLFILGFITGWNDYESFLVWYPSTPNLSYGMYVFQYRATAGSSGAIRDPHILAGYTLVMLPSLIIYSCGQKVMRSKLTVGGLKG